MRFHCGISFSWRTIKKFLFPILIGFLAYFGFNFVYDSNTPLGFIKVKALENYETWFDYNYTDLSSYDSQVLDNNGVTFSQYLDHIKSLTGVVKDYSISIYIDNNSITNINYYVFSNEDPYTFNLYGLNTGNFVFKFNGTSNFMAYYSTNLSNTISNIYTSNPYKYFSTCITGGNCGKSSNFYNENILGHTTDTIDNISNNTFNVNSGVYVLYYSTRDLIINNTYNTSNNSIFYKSLRVNNQNIEVSSKFPTYTDYIESQNTPTPDPDPIPDPDDPDVPINHSGIFNKVYWFDDNTTEIGILSNIYILLFFYIFGILFLKFISYISNVKWKGR